jgi:hypothetical protein
MAGSPPDRSNPASVTPRKVCYLSRRKGWTDPAQPRRRVADVNLLAIYLEAPVWTLRTAWVRIFNSLIPESVERAYVTATAGARVSDSEIRVLREVADRLRVELRVID